MKSLKFRIWDKEEERMRRVALMNILPSGKVLSVQCVDKNNELEIIDADDKEIMQQTGIKDKNGKDIWEGDILEFTYEDESSDLAVIGFKNGSFVALDKDSDVYCDNWELDEDEPCNWKVIGNIYQNEYLIELDN